MSTTKEHYAKGGNFFFFFFFFFIAWTVSSVFGVMSEQLYVRFFQDTLIDLSNFVLL